MQVALVDRRHGPGGHWLDAYPFVRLHQASSFYGVASTMLGSGSIQREGPEAGLHERAGAAEICAYYQRVLNEQLVPSGRVEFHPNCEYLGDGSFVSRISGQGYQAGPDCRIVDARYLAPEIPATTEPPFGVADGVRALPVNELPRLETAPREFVIVGSGKTATDACGGCSNESTRTRSLVAPRAVDVQPRSSSPTPPVIGMAADTGGGGARLPDDLFLRMEPRYAPHRPLGDADQRRHRPRPVGLDLFAIERVVRLGHSAGSSRADRTGRGRCRDRQGRGDRPLRRVRPAVPAADPDLGRQAITFSRSGRASRAWRRTIVTPRDTRQPASLAALGHPTDWAVRPRAASSAFRRARHQEWADSVALNPARVPPGEAVVDDDLAAAASATVGPGSRASRASARRRRSRSAA